MAKVLLERYDQVFFPDENRYGIVVNDQFCLVFKMEDGRWVVNSDKHPKIEAVETSTDAPTGPKLISSPVAGPRRGVEIPKEISLAMGAVIQALRIVAPQ